MQVWSDGKCEPVVPIRALLLAHGMIELELTRQTDEETGEPLLTLTADETEFLAWVRRSNVRGLAAKLKAEAKHRAAERLMWPSEDTEAWQVQQVHG